MNACLQCLLPIETMRDYFINQEYIRFKEQETVSNSFDYCSQFQNFYKECYTTEYSSSGNFLNPTGLKNLIRKKFLPIMQHDSHEFLMHLIGLLQDEETPIKNKKFNGDVEKKNSNRTIA